MDILTIEEYIIGELYLNLLEEIIDTLLTTSLVKTNYAAGNMILQEFLITANNMEVCNTTFSKLDTD